MRIIIVGAGDVGTHLAKLLSRENMEISLMDEKPDRLAQLEANYDLLTRVGSPTSLKDLKEIRVKDVDLFIAVTPHESVNMTACLLANKLGAKKTLARIDNPEYLKEDNLTFLKELGLDHLIYPESLASKEIIDSLHTNWMRYNLKLTGGNLELCVVKVRQNAIICGQRFASGFYSHGKYRIVAIKRGNETIIPRGSDCVMPGDLCFVVCTRKNRDFVCEQAGKTKRRITNVMVFGGSSIAVRAILDAPDFVTIKLIEPNLERCEKLAAMLPNAMVIHGNGNDMDFLKEEGVEDVDAFVSLTDNSETNIFACLAAKRFGVYKTIANVENMDYITMAEGLDIGTVINKKTITASYIYQMLLDAEVLNVQNLTSVDAQIVEFVAQEGSKVTKRQIRDLDLPQDCNIGALVRSGVGILVNGDTQIMRDDLVVVFCRSHIIRDLEKYFK